MRTTGLVVACLVLLVSACGGGDSAEIDALNARIAGLQSQLEAATSTNLKASRHR